LKKEKKIKKHVSQDRKGKPEYNKKETAYKRQR
jgi:hypothetical protein